MSDTATALNEVEKDAGWVKSRLSERSTWAGVGMLAGVIGLHISPTMMDAIQHFGVTGTDFVLAVCGLIAGVTSGGK